MSNEVELLDAAPPADHAAPPTDPGRSQLPTVGRGRLRPNAKPQSGASHRGEGDDASTGRRLDRYTVVKRLGGGGMGEVYLARHHWLDIPVAIKVLHPSFDDDAKALERFRREARLVAGLNHPNIVRALDGGPVEGSFYLATEYLDGLDLEQRVRTEGPLPPAYAAWVIVEIARALDYAHQRQLIHRDIKPSNIMLLRDGSVKLLDLGLARNLDSSSAMTSTGQFMGTVDYVSPEQALDTRNVDSRTDIYSLGCTLYFLVAGRAPFEGEAYDSIASKILAHTEEQPAPLEAVCRKAPRRLQAVVGRMMEKSPEKRMQSAAEVIKTLSPLAEPPGNHMPLVLGRPNSSPGLMAAIDDGVAKLFKGMFHALWIMLRTILSIIGLMERVELPATSRLGGRKQYAWKVSVNGVAMLIGLVLFLLFFFTQVVIIEPYDPGMAPFPDGL